MNKNKILIIIFIIFIFISAVINGIEGELNDIDQKSINEQFFNETNSESIEQEKKEPIKKFKQTSKFSLSKQIEEQTKKGNNKNLELPKKEATQESQKQINENKQEKETAPEIVKEKKIPKQKIKAEEKKFQLNFENAALRNVLSYIEELFDVTFFPDDAVGDEKKIKGVGDVKITFKSNRPISEKQVWDFLDLILEVAGLARIQMAGQNKSFFRITQIATANKSNIPTYVGIDINEIPDFQRIRYMYFVQNRQVTQIRDLLVKLQSKNAQIEIFQDLNVLILTDSAYNVKTLMQIVQELDSSGLPEVLSVLKLKSADSTEVAKLYESLKGKEDIFRPFGESKKGSRLTENTKVIAEPRTNSIIIFGPKDSVVRFEEFVKKYVDIDLQEQPEKIEVYELNYAPAEQIASILNAVTQFGAESETAKLGGIRGGEKYLSKLYFEPEKQGNRLIIRGDPEDRAIAKKIVKELDIQQPQVAIEVFILTINLDRNKAWNSQVHNSRLGKINYQTSGGFTDSGIQVNTTNNSGSLVTNLINLALASIPGSTLISIGRQSVWGIFSILESTSDVKIISNPFIVATNKYTATVSLGETRKVQTGTIIGASTETNEFGTDQANLSVSITPQINDYGIVNLDIDVTIDNFINPETSPQNALKETRRVHTNANVADQEVLALGGLIRDRVDVKESGIPLICRIPIIGFLFKNKQNIIRKENLIILMSPRIIRPHKELISPFTLNKAERVKITMEDIDNRANKKDPVYRWFFKEPMHLDKKVVNRFLLPSEQKAKEISEREKKENINDVKIQQPVLSRPPRKNNSLVDFVTKKT